MDKYRGKREEIFSSYAERDKISEEFEKQREIIEDRIGIKLSNIELAGLRRITEEVMKQVAQDAVEGVSGDYSIAPFEEIPTRFVFEFYDVRLSDLPKKRISYLTLNKPTDFDAATRVWFKREQEKRHLI